MDRTQAIDGDASVCLPVFQHYVDVFFVCMSCHCVMSMCLTRGRGVGNGPGLRSRDTLLLAQVCG